MGDNLWPGIVCGPFWRSFTVRGSFAIRDHLWYCTVLLKHNHTNYKTNHQYQLKDIYNEGVSKKRRVLIDEFHLTHTTSCQKQLQAKKNYPVFIVAITYPNFNHPYIFDLLALASSLFSHSSLLSTLILHTSEMIRSLQKADKSDFVSFIYRTLQSEILTYVNWGQSSVLQGLLVKCNVYMNVRLW